MLTTIKRILLYFYILYTRYKQRDAAIEQLKHRCRPKKDIQYDKPRLPDLLDDIDGVPNGWTEAHSFTAFDRDGACVHISLPKGLNERKKTYLHIPPIGTLFYSELDDDDMMKDEEWYKTTKKRLKAEVVDPMMTWKLAFRGHAEKENGAAEGGKSTCFVRFHLYWKSTGDPFDFWLDTPPWQLAGVCSDMGFTDALQLLDTKSIWYEQWGELHGSLAVDGVETRIRMPARRERKYIVGEKAFEHRVEFAKSQIIEIDTIAHRYSHTAVTYRDGKQLQFGQVLFPSLESYSIKKEGLQNEQNAMEMFTMNFLGKAMTVSKEAGRRIVLNKKHDLAYNKYNVDGRQATGVILKSHMRDTSVKDPAAQHGVGGRSRSHPTTAEKVKPTDKKVLLVGLSDARCRDKNLVGGKAANLSSLLAFGYKVPQAFCVTTNAFNMVSRDNTDLSKAIDDINRVITEHNLDKLKEACDKAVEGLSKCHIGADLVSEVGTKLEKMTSLQKNGIAIRSSAIGEDGEVLSSAGQLESILGVRSLDKAFEALKQCWSSYLSFQSVEYRRQNGQVIVDGMGVVFQEMIPSEVSGVLMTNDPLSGREDRLLLNACFGLGEAVVSGKIDPDTFVIGVEEGGEISILKEDIGVKSQRVDLSPSGGTQVHDHHGPTQSVSCLSRDWIHRICKVGKSIERTFRLEQEIEWAIQGGCLYILQTRPITSLDVETEEDVFHEFDTPAFSDRELVTSCNVQEMMPGATTPLTVQVFNRAISDAFGYVFLDMANGLKNAYHPHGFNVSCGNKHFLNMTPIYNNAVNGIGGLKSKVFLDIDVLGSEYDAVTDDDILEYKGTRLNTPFKVLYYLAKNSLIVGPKFDRDFLQWEDKMQTYAIGEGETDASKLYRCIDEDRRYLVDGWRHYFHFLVNPYLTIIKGMLMSGSNTFTQDNKEDLANILIKCGTVSADVPKAIANIAKTIKDCGLSGEFVHLSDEDCLNVLRDNEALKQLLDDFLKRHGHRGIREAEFFEKNWYQNPTKLVKALKSILKNGIVERMDDETDESKITDILNNLKTDVSPFKRWIMKKFLLKGLLQKVLDRERGKSFVIKFIGAFKIAYWSLAKLLVRDGKLPDEDLMFFLTHREIGEVIDTRSPRLIRKAKRRMKMYPRQKSTEYERLSFGFPKRLVEPENSAVEPLKPSVVVEGMPVGNGEAIGRACIVTKEADVVNIQRGDILICQYTDVGWSPYFPMISGLVTEIGSILSHGAVVARECGIPCVVNVKHATSLFTSGDKVRVNGTRGTVEKLPES